MVLRKQTSDEVAFLDEIARQVDSEVETQLKNMLELEDEKDPNFSDSDYQLAAYAAALRVLIIAILRYLGGLQSEHWKQDAEAAQLLAGTVENDHV